MTNKEEDIRFYSAYAQSVIAGLERLKNRTGSLTPSQEAELAVNKIALGVLQPPRIEFHVKRHPAPQCVPVSAVIVADPKAPSTWPKWEHAERRDCGICFAEGVATVHDPDGIPRCADCWEDLQPCVNCGNVSTRPQGVHYCTTPKKTTSKPRIEPDPEPEDDGSNLNQQECGRTGHDFMQTGKGWECISCGFTTEDGPE